MPIGLTVAGSDSGGGAGVQADLKTFAALDVHGVAALTCVTAQNPRRVRRISACAPSVVRDQLEAVFEELTPAAGKTGMLYSEEIIRAVAGFFRRYDLPVVVDPVMVSTSGAPLLAPRAIETLCRRLLPLAVLITPNVPEAEALLATRLRSVEDLRRVAGELHRRFGTAVLVKGGHLKGLNQAVDIFRDGHQELLLSAPFIRGIHTHGTGCTYSAAIAACLAKGRSLSESVIMGKEFVTQAIARSRSVRGHSVLNYMWNRGKR
jgi:hydroxymethylpyrimidine/phosphomethylpyrimidine kinase